MSNWNKKFREGFTGKEEVSNDKSKLSYKERLAARMAKMSPEEKAERQRKIEAQSYEDGGAVGCSKGKENKLAVLAKLSKSKRK